MVYASAVMVLRESMTSLEEVRSVPEIAAPAARSEPALMVLDPSLSKAEGTMWESGGEIILWYIELSGDGTGKLGIF